MKLFVAKLPPNVTSERLRAMFESYGQVVDAKIIMDRDTGKSKCYGFVEMADGEGAKAAIDSLNGIQMEGKEILVKESDPAPPRSGGNDFNRGPRQGGGGGGFRPSYNSGGSGGGGGDRRPSGGPRPDRWNDDRNRGGSGGGGSRYGDNDRNKRRYDEDDDKPRRKRI
jgi:cold-inducible RNA-binding protein